MGDPHYVAATAIVIKKEDGRFRYLISQRSMSEENFPGLWTVPGGTLEEADHKLVPVNESGQYYNVMDAVVKREVEEEVGLQIDNIRYLLSLAYPKKKGPALCLSFYADHVDGKVKLNHEMIDYAWITVDNLPKYNIIQGIPEEIVMVEDILNNRPVKSWDEYKRIVARMHGKN
ncbi:NUDIX domain-containing protein [Candidatus Woesearchaeota archaeon]|nr:NUDIX domain-containing protein [Candidatus Woesearchaeota archaeon]